MNSLLSSPSFNWQSANVTAELYEFKQHAELTFEGPLEGAKDASKIAPVHLWLGSDGRQIYNAWEEDASKKTLVAFWVYLAKYVSPSSNFWLSRIYLSRLRQQPDESIDTYMTNLRLQGQRCEFRDTTEVQQRLTEQIVIGVRESIEQNCMFSQHKSMSLESA